MCVNIQQSDDVFWGKEQDFLAKEICVYHPYDLPCKIQKEVSYLHPRYPSPGPKIGPKAGILTGASTEAPVLLSSVLA